MFYFILIISLVIVVYVIIIYNRFIRYSNRIENALSAIDVALKKRFDLIPNLIESVKGYMDHEKGLLTELTKIRGEAAKLKNDLPEKLRLGENLSSVFSRIVINSENYPDIKASGNMLHLQKTLTELEEQISAARRSYNSAVADMNNLVQSFPSMILASVFGFSSGKFLEIPEREKNPVTTKFN